MICKRQKVTPALTRKVPDRPLPALRAVSSASLASSTARLAFSKNARPASVGVRPRVERSSNLTASRASSCATPLETAGWPIPKRFAAAENEPVSTTWTKVSMAVRRSIGMSFWRWRFGNHGAFGMRGEVSRLA